MSLRQLRPYGESAQLLECVDLSDAQAVHRWLREQQHRQIAEIIPGARTLLLRLSADLPPAARDSLLNESFPPQPREPAELITIDVRYDGEDLAAVSDLLDLTPHQLIDRHTGQDWTVAFCGFSPGFGYLAATDRPLPVPRRASPRSRVPAGAVALADHWSAVYPSAGPGGWQLIGNTSRRLFDPTADPPATLRPGMRVRFRRID